MRTPSTRITPYNPQAGRLLITDHGTHPPEAWAQVTAEHIAPLGDKLTGRRRAAAIELQLKIAEALEPHHGKVQEVERSKLLANHDHIMAPVNPEEHLDEAMAAIHAAAKGTDWEEQFNPNPNTPMSKEDAAALIVKATAEAHDFDQPNEDVARALETKRAWDRVALLRREVGAHFATAQHIEKSHHADNNTSHPAAVAFREQHHPGA